MKKRALTFATAGACAALWILVNAAPEISAQRPAGDPNTCDPADCGQVSAFIPMQSTEAVHMGLVWKKGSQKPKILYHARFPEYIPNDVADPAVVDAAIAAGALTDGLGRNDFNPSLRDVLHPSFRNGSDPHADSFQRLTYGGYLLRQGLSQSVPTRIRANRTMERQLLFDINHPDAFKTAGKFHTALLSEADFALNRAAFAENGYSKGLFYNTYCNARVTLSDGRVYVFGGHDMQSNNGLYKVNIFDPNTEEWVRRREPCTRENWRLDPFGLALFLQTPNAQFYDDCDPRNQQSTQPSEDSDQKYARWYPSAIPLPGDMVLVVGGFDQDNTIGPDPDRVAKGINGQTQSDSDFTNSRVNIVVPELYDPKTDRNIALENARMAFPLYPQLEVIQTGPGQEDWKVCMFGGEENFGAAAAGGAKFFGPWTGKTWCLDVLAALRDPDRDVPGQRHWQQLDTALEARPYCCPTASLIELDAEGNTVSHKWFMISGRDENDDQTGTVESIEFTDPSPQWQKVGTILQPLSTTKAVLLPDGKVLIGQGVNRSSACNVDGRPCTYEEKEGLHFQMFDPVTGSIRRLARTTVSRGLHGTATLLPDASVFFAGENREALVRTDDPSFPMMTSYAGLVPRGDPDLGVPVGQLFFPPYLHNRGGGRSSRPVIVHAPAEISYGGHFDVRIAGRASEVASIALLRSDHNTHSLTAGDRYVKLAFHIKGDPSRGEVRVVAPKLPAQAVPGVYMLFVVDKNGVPSIGKRIDLR